ncbi:YolD-like family protein [Thalassobacillus sp. CUG 92003]|uniref:YolD-like family protein n=1 Tax=Thalassobacillus sp. CUG 92003 TaxID=2736641 RepID=UPI0015E770C9|nr:YolD-like family protein [Thalassobacillus sp. CUG 92003]
MAKRNREQTKQWTTMMLPEQVARLKQTWQGDARVEKGLIDERKAVEIDFLLQRAVNDNLPVAVEYVNSINKDVLELKIDRMNRVERKIYAKDWHTKKPVTLNLDDVTNLHIV